MEKPILKDTVTTQLLDRCQPSGKENPADLRRRNMTEAKICSWRLMPEIKERHRSITIFVQSQPFSSGNRCFWVSISMNCLCFFWASVARLSSQIQPGQPWLFPDTIQHLTFGSNSETTVWVDSVLMQLWNCVHLSLRLSSRSDYSTHKTESNCFDFSCCVHLTTALYLMVSSVDSRPHHHPSYLLTGLRMEVWGETELL